MKPLVSVIVPVYNVEPWLERCLDSLAGQTMKEIEIIVVDDGSQDRCGEICDAYAAKDERFRVVHQENRGLSAARNVGIELAQADYLMFVDSDDWVDPEFCRLPYETAVEHGAELVIFLYSIEKKGEESVCSPRSSEGIKERLEAVKLLYHGSKATAWNKLYHRKLFVGLRYPEGRCYEDSSVTHKAVYHAEGVYLLRSSLYYYNSKREGSITQTHTNKNETDRYEMIASECSDLERWGLTEEAAKKKLLASVLYLVAEGKKARYSEECLSYCRSFSLNTVHLTRKIKGMLFLLRYMPPVFDLVCIMLGRRVAATE